jgi:hypothetical protein
MDQSLFRLTARDGGDLEAEEQRQLHRPATLWWAPQARSNLKMMNALNAYNSARDAVNLENDVSSRAPSA